MIRDDDDDDDEDKKSIARDSSSTTSSFDKTVNFVFHSSCPKFYLHTMDRRMKS